MAERRRRQQCHRAHHRRQREGSHQVRHRELGLRRRARAADRHVVVARQPDARLLPLRREAGPGLLPADEPDAGPGHARRRGLSQAGQAQSRSSISSSTTWPRRRPSKIDVRDGKPFDNATVGHYVYNVPWSPDGQDILLNRTNRKQNILEFAACSPETGKCRAIVHEEWPTGWIENRPEMRFLKDGKRFIWESQRNGFKNFYLYDLSGKLIAPLIDADGARGRQHRDGRRGAQPPLLHGARRRQLHEAAAASRRARRQGTTSA